MSASNIESVLGFSRLLAIDVDRTCFNTELYKTVSHNEALENPELYVYSDVLQTFELLQSLGVRILLLTAGKKEEQARKIECLQACVGSIVLESLIVPPLDLQLGLGIKALQEFPDTCALFDDNPVQVRAWAGLNPSTGEGEPSGRPAFQITRPGERYAERAHPDVPQFTTLYAAVMHWLDVVTAP